MIIDITADQFADSNCEIEPVIITDSSDFHSSFNNVESYELNSDSLKNTAIANVLDKVRALM